MPLLQLKRHSWTLPFSAYHCLYLYVLEEQIFVLFLRIAAV